MSPVFIKRAVSVAAACGIAVALSGCAQVRQHCEQSDLSRLGCVAIAAGIIGGTIAIIAAQDDNSARSEL